MKLLRKVSKIEVKRCFAVSNLRAKQLRKSRGKTESKAEYLRRLAKVKTAVMSMDEKALDRLIATEYAKRLDAYDSCEWHIAEISPIESGVWTRAGELPLRWTNKTLEATAEKVKRALDRKNGFRNKRTRAAHAIKGILLTSIDSIQGDPLLFPIAFKGDTGTRPRKRLKMKTRADIDDGCMRSIALAVNGTKKILMYYGVPKR